MTLESIVRKFKQLKSKRIYGVCKGYGKPSHKYFNFKLHYKGSYNSCNSCLGNRLLDEYVGCQQKKEFLETEISKIYKCHTENVKGLAWERRRKCEKDYGKRK